MTSNRLLPKAKSRSSIITLRNTLEPALKPALAPVRENPSSVLLLVAHPGHEVRLHHWLEITRPIVCILTDGSGGNAVSRLDSSSRLLARVGAIQGPIYGVCSDREFYDIIREGRSAKLIELAAALVDFLHEYQITTLVADMMEGYNTTHDVCRFLAGAVVEKIRRTTGRVIENLDFPLEGLPDRLLAVSPEKCHSYRLDAAALERKIAAAHGYEQLRTEVDRAVATYGNAPFQHEILRHASQPNGLTWEEKEPPYYEIYGAKMIAEGRYTDLITFAEHLQPLAVALWTWATTKENG